MRLILAAAMLASIALPAAAQRLDDRVVGVRTDADGVSCRLSANNRVRLVESSASAYLLQRPVDADPRIDVSLGMIFSPSTGASVMGLQFLPLGGTPPPQPTAARLLIDGTDSGVHLLLQGDPDQPGAVYVTVPDADRPETAKRMIDARWFEFEVSDGASARPRRYRFDGLRIRDVAEILSIIHYRCGGPRAD